MVENPKSPDGPTYLDNLIVDCARTILKIAQDKSRADHARAIEGVIRLVVVRVQQIERGQIQNDSSGPKLVE